MQRGAGWDCGEGAGLRGVGGRAQSGQGGRVGAAGAQGALPAGLWRQLPATNAVHFPACLLACLCLPACRWITTWHWRRAGSLATACPHSAHSSYWSGSGRTGGRAGCMQQWDYWLADPAVPQPAGCGGSATPLCASLSPATQHRRCCPARRPAGFRRTTMAGAFRWPLTFLCMLRSSRPEPPPRLHAHSLIHFLLRHVTRRWQTPRAVGAKGIAPACNKGEGGSVGLPDGLVSVGTLGQWVKCLPLPLPALPGKENRECTAAATEGRPSSLTTSQPSILS